MDLAAELRLGAEGNWREGTPLGSAEERTDHLVQRTAAVAHTGSVQRWVEEVQSQSLVGSTLARHRILQPLPEVEQEHMGLDHRHLRKDRVLHFQLHLS